MHPSAGPSETLDQGNCASLGDLSRKSGLLAKMGGDAAIDDAKQDQRRNGSVS